MILYHAVLAAESILLLLHLQFPLYLLLLLFLKLSKFSEGFTLFNFLEEIAFTIELMLLKVFESDILIAVWALSCLAPAIVLVLHKFVSRNSKLAIQALLRSC